MNNKHLLVLPVAAMLLGGWSWPWGEVKIAENGQAKAEIVLGEHPVGAAQFAALELQAHLKAITGADYAIVSEAKRNADLYPIFVGATKASVGEYDPKDFGEQEYVLDIDGDRTILFGRDGGSTQKVSVVYQGGPGVVAGATRLPDRWSARGTLNATYDFLRDQCGVRWLDFTEAGTIIPSKPTLAVKRGMVKGAPFTRCRDADVYPEEWDRRRSPRETEVWRRTACPLACASSKDSWAVHLRFNLLRDVFALRSKLGGTKIHANHSFYWCYDRFWDKKDPNFIAYHPEWFSKHYKRTKKGQGESGVYAEVDTSRRPGQMCFSNEEFLKQTIIDVRAYFDVGGYTNRYTNQGVPCDAKHPVASWGKDVYCLEPMDNDANCECEKCRAQYHSEKGEKGSSAYSDYWFTFVNKVARAIKASHPGKKISTLAYGGCREGLPSFPLEDNIVVHFCWDSNRVPNNLVAWKRQLKLMREWRENYPKNPFGIWLYNGFPHESGTWYSYLPIPGFFGKLYDWEMKFLRDLDMRECVFNCGFKDDFELYLGGRLMWNPNEDYETLKNEFFSSYGPAEPAVRKFYDIVEDRFCNTNNYKNANGQIYGGHMKRNVAWGMLIRDQEFSQLAACMAEGEAAIKRGTPQQQARFRNWKVGYWDYIRQAKTPRKEFKSPKEGVKLICTECFCTRECEFGDKDILAGIPVKVLTGKGSTGEPWGLSKGDTKKLIYSMTGKGNCNAFWNLGTPSQLVYRCEVKISQLKRFRIVTCDPARSCFFFNLVGWRGNEKVMLIEGVRITQASFCEPGVTVWDFEFDPKAAPANLDAIGIEERYPEIHIYEPRYLHLRAADWKP